jgi:hypothetical protein
MMPTEHAAEAAEKLVVAKAAMAMTLTAARAGRWSGRRRRARGRGRGRSAARIAREEAGQLAAESVAKRQAGTAR